MFSDGPNRASGASMKPAKKLEELVTWQLACALRDNVRNIVENGPANRDFDFRDQILNSSRSAPSNIAEGFGHIRPRQFARYLRIARASVVETANHIHEGTKKKHFSKSDAQLLLMWVKRTLGAIRSLVEYLDSCPPDRDWTGRNDSPRRNRDKGRPSNHDGGKPDASDEPVNPNPCEPEPVNLNP